MFVYFFGQRDQVRKDVFPFKELFCVVKVPLRSKKQKDFSFSLQLRLRFHTINLLSLFSEVRIK